MHNWVLGIACEGIQAGGNENGERAESCLKSQLCYKTLADREFVVSESDAQSIEGVDAHANPGVSLYKVSKI
jgi:hypothetical protein